MSAEESDTESDTVSLVVPTYNRAEALRVNLGMMLAMQDVAEVIVVNDGSTDDTLEVCAQFADERLRIISHPKNLGVARARNTGIEAAARTWVLFGEDDCRFPPDYATVLRLEAERYTADLVGAPLLHVSATDQQIPQIAATAPRQEKPSMEDVGVFPCQAIETPFLPARALVRRVVFEQIRFYEGFLVNGYREETDFFVQAARAGFCCVLTPSTYCYQLDTWHGGQHNSSTLRYEYWALRNNWLFLRRHGSWLVEQGYIRGRMAAQLRFAWNRFATLSRGAVLARVTRVKSALGRNTDSSRAS